MIKFRASVWVRDRFKVKAKAKFSFQVWSRAKIKDLGSG